MVTVIDNKIKVEDAYDVLSLCHAILLCSSMLSAKCYLERTHELGTNGDFCYHHAEATGNLMMFSINIYIYAR